MQTLRITRLIHKRKARKSRESHRPSVVLGRWSLMLASIILLLFLGGLLVAALQLAQQIDRLPAVDQMEVLLNPQDGVLLQPSRIVDRSGEILLLELQSTDTERRFLTMNGNDAFSAWLPLLTVSVEDPDFWQRSIIEVFFRDPNTEPGIAENLVNDLLLWQFQSSGQFEHGLLTAQMLLEYGHEQILTWYLNTAEYGHMAYGAEQAAQLFLGKSATDLNLAESALLVASAQFPALNPWDAPVAALENMNALLAQMLDANVITLKEFEEARMSEVILTINPSPQETKSNAFTEAVLKTLEEEIPRQRLERGGFTIMTTLDADLQQQLECSTLIQLARINTSDGNDGTDLELCPAARLLSPLPPTESFDAQFLQASGLVMNPRSGEVLAYIDRQTQGDHLAVPLEQQPGSLLSSFVALTAFTRGAGPATLRWDIPGDEPANLLAYVKDNENYQGPLRTRTALANDDTLVFAEWMNELGEADVLSLSSKFSWLVDESKNPNTSVLFEGGETDLLQTALAYSTFANLGTQTGIEGNDDQSLKPALILSVSDNAAGVLVLNCTTPQSHSLLSPALAYLVHDILSDEVSRRDTLGYPSPLSIGRPSAAKIAFSAKNSQSWTVGYTPERLVLTWFGSTQPQTLDYRLSAGLWHALIQYSSQSLPIQGWEQPAGLSQIVVCDPSGLLPTSDCPSVVNELFLSGNEPGAVDDLYHTVAINHETGRLATVFTPLELIEEKTFLIVPPEAEEWAQAEGLLVPPASYDAIYIAAPQPDAHITLPAIFSYVRGNIDIIGSASGEGFSNYRIQVGEGLNPQEWFQIGESVMSSVTEGILTRWDTTGLEGLYAMRLIVQRGTQEIETATIQVTVDNTPPTMTILSPQPGESMKKTTGGEVNLQVRPEDNIGIATVQWFIDGKLAAERAQAPFSAFLRLKTGDHQLIVEVIDLAGNSTRSEELVFTVD